MSNIVYLLRNYFCGCNSSSKLARDNVDMRVNELEKKKYDLLLYVEYPEFSDFESEELEYLMKSYRFKVLSSGEYRLFLFYLDA